MTPPNLPESLWDWSPQAAAQFFKAAYVQNKKRLEIRAGLNAALLEDLDRLAPTLARLWIEAVTGEDTPRHVVTITQGETVVQIPITRALLMHACQLPELIEGVPDVQH